MEKNIDLKINKVVHLFDKMYDRWLYIEYDVDDEIIGLNFMQGGDYEYFKRRWCMKDRGLLDFYNQMLTLFPIERSSVDEIEFINKCMWSYHVAMACYDEYKD